MRIFLSAPCLTNLFYLALSLARSPALSHLDLSFFRGFFRTKKNIFFHFNNFIRKYMKQYRHTHTHRKGVIIKMKKKNFFYLPGTIILAWWWCCWLTNADNVFCIVAVPVGWCCCCCFECWWFVEFTELWLFKQNNWPDGILLASVRLWVCVCVYSGCRCLIFSWFTWPTI